MSRTHIDSATAHEVKVAIVWWMIIAGMCVGLANALAAHI